MYAIIMPNIAAKKFFLGIIDHSHADLDSLSRFVLQKLAQCGRNLLSYGTFAQ